MSAQNTLDLLPIGSAVRQGGTYRPGLFGLLCTLSRPEDEACLTRRAAGNPCPLLATALRLALEHIDTGNPDLCPPVVTSFGAGLRALRAPGYPAPPQPAAQVEPLSRRELEVLRLLPTGLSVPEIAEYLVVAPSTVRTHVKRIYGKLDVHTRDDAIAQAGDLGLL